MPVAKEIRKSIESSSWIRKMFEEGGRLKAKFGEENVYDFSIGNPDADPPEKFFEVMQKLASQKEKGIHGYMPNAGFDFTREAIAGKAAKDHGITIKGNSIVMTCGASGALNISLKALLDPGDEVIVIRPYFVEYGAYISNHGGKMVLADSAEDCSLDIDNIEKAITDRTKAVIINSPHNPTGKIYSEDEIKKLSALLEAKSVNKAIYLISDEPYREIVYDNKFVPSILKHYRNSIVGTSYSKSLSLPGERIGFCAVNPEADDHDTLVAGLILANRILGFVNAPAFMQRVVCELTEETVDVEAYKRKRDLLMKGLRDAGYEFINPEGAFYIFCKSPVEDDVAFVQHLQKYNILVVPGTGFGGPGYFRITYCVSIKTIERSIPVFKKALGIACMKSESLPGSLFILKKTAKRII